jgi:histone deacetylase complex subunit SAP30
MFAAVLTCGDMQINWPAFDRSVLHAYSREHRLNTATSFTCSYHECLLTQPGGIGMYSPTMARKKRHARRQNKDNLAMAVRKHFNGVGIQENDVIVDFIYKIKVDNASKATGPNSHVIFSAEA